MRAKKIDSNQNEIVRKLRQIPGVSVAVTSGLGDGFGDIVVGYRRKNFLVEIKDPDKPPSQRKLTDDEKKFHDGWQGQIDVCESFDDVFKLINE